MNRKFVKRISVRTFDELMQKMKEAKSLGFLVDVTQFSEEPALFDWSDEGVYRITLFEAVKEEEDKGGTKRYIIRSGESFLERFQLSDDDKILESVEMTTHLSAAMEVPDYELSHGEGLVTTIVNEMRNRFQYKDISWKEVK
ncbi:hypothetical protein PPK16_gp77 [Bacillus phage 049ML001]|uniref:Uncharacterized protein n=1 Tax=Bacillus phage 049ML001 TaxID=2601660 RepID=A0A5P8PI87_9CAUD|nr:hypothetical protein PPK16_gp77 [Bacillus phage 049ML001]QFR56379.1 hypothetical protein 049ML001_77 [Bacillus phage 049ML001]